MALRRGRAADAEETDTTAGQDPTRDRLGSTAATTTRRTRGGDTSKGNGGSATSGSASDAADQAAMKRAAREAVGPTQMPARASKPPWGYVLRKTWHEFSADQCTNLAAALTYYAVLALFPALIALLSVVGLVGKKGQSVNTILSILTDMGANSAVKAIRPTLEQLSGASGAGVALLVGILGALWSASGYVGAFGRAMNRIYHVQEGRPVWKLRPAQLLVTLVLVVLVALALVALIVSGPLTTSIGKQLGVGSTATTVWSIAKWPALALVVVVIVAILYWATPNVRQPRFRLVSVGAVVAILTWAVMSALFGFYVAHFSSYDKTYGSLAGVIAFLLWLWITNLALLFGGELDAEVERGKQLAAGTAAEDQIQLPARDRSGIEKKAVKREADVQRGREIRENADSDSDSDSDS